MFWIEVLSRQKEIIQRHHAAADSVTIGRAYDNGVIVDDPYVAPAHVRICRDESGAMVAEDLATQNGLLDEKGKRHHRISLTGNQLIRIGHTWLRVRDANFKVADERPLQPQRRLWPGLMAMLILLPGFFMLNLWLRNTGDYSITLYLGQFVSLATGIAIWIGFWSLLTRLLTGAACFTLHAIIALTGIFALQIISFTQDWLVFAFSSNFIAQYSFPLFWFLFALICFAHMCVISSKNTYRKAAIVFSLAACASMAQWFMDNPLIPEDSGAKRPYLTRMYPPSWRVIAPETELEFFAEAEKLKAQLDELRKKEPRRGMFDNFLNDFNDGEMAHR